MHQALLDRMRELNAQWTTMKTRSLELADRDIPAVNKRLWDADLRQSGKTQMRSALSAFEKKFSAPVTKKFDNFRNIV